MKTRIFKTILFAIALLIAIYVTVFRIFTLFFELGLKIPKTDNLKNFIVFNLPDLISVIFCAYFIFFFYKKLKYLWQGNGNAPNRELPQ